MRRIGTTALDVFEICLGGNVFGWTADEAQSFAVLDAYAGTGGNFIDTADAYAAWVPGNSGGESETIIGRWMAARRNRGEMIIGTKVGAAPGVKGLSEKTISTAVEASLRRLQTDYIDLYYAHYDDVETPIEETMSAFDALVQDGKVRYVAASNYSAPRLTEALAVADREGLARYVALQTEYNLVERPKYEGDLSELCVREGLSCLPYYALAKGFLTGKYRPDAQVESARAEAAQAYLDGRGVRLLGVLADLAAAHDASPAAVSLAWLLAQPTVAAPIASARTATQVEDLLPAATLQLTDSDLDVLAAVSAP
ncbi:MAG: aldo/keto reductase [Actinomycetota bacterium]|nr:aldo/keto reductase [Actinomycetota bacterium]